LRFLHVQRLQLLEGHRLPGNLPPDPLDRRPLIGDEQLQLFDLAHVQPAPVVVRHLFRQKVHAVPFRVPLKQAGVER